MAKISKEYALVKGAKGICLSPDAKEGFREIDLEKASQEQLAFLYKRKVSLVVKN